MDADCLGEGRQIPSLCRTEIAREAEELLDECWDGFFPVDVEAVCDYLNIAILPVRGLADDFGVEAFISADFRTIYVDLLEYEHESSRYRFSLAHELGHFVLHKEYYPSKVENFEEWLGFARGLDNGYAEYQANYFAANLLAPEDELVRIMNREFGGSFARNCLDKNHMEFRNILYNVRRFFMVSEQVVARRMRDVFPGAEGFDEIADAIR